jgi:hypothetical protein
MYKKTNNNSVAPSMMQLKEKCMNLASLKHIHLTDGWGWFIDIETNNNNILETQINNKYTRQTSKPILIPQTFKQEILFEKTFNEETFNEETFNEEIFNEEICKEESISRVFKSIKSIKSIETMGKLHDDSMIFEMDELNNKKKEKNKGIVNILKNLFIIGIVCVCYGFLLL